MNYRLRIYKDRQKRWRWTLFASNGCKVACSGEGYSRPGHARRMAHKLFPWFLAMLLLTTGCAVAPPPVVHPTQPPPDPAYVAAVENDCAGLYRSELKREIDDIGLAGCRARGLAGAAGWQEDVRAFLRTTDEYAALHATRPLPAIPTRVEVISINVEWQGLTVFGEPWFEPYLGWRDYTREQRAEVYQAKRQPRPGAPSGDTHLMLSLDMTGLASLPKLKALAREYIAEEGGAGIQLMCMGDGNEAGRENHDPGALNWPWLMANFPAIYDYMKAGPDGEDLTPWIVFVPGFDGVVPGWQPWSRVNEFARMARGVIDRGGSGYLGLELSAGYAVWTGETNDWATEDGKRFDVIIQEFPIDVHPEYGPPAALLNPDRTWRSDVDNDQRNPWSQVYQIVGRMVRPFNRPAYMPNDDMNPSFHLQGGTPRGPQAYICGEIDTYRWVRVRNISLAEVNAHREALLAMGCRLVG